MIAMKHVGKVFEEFDSNSSVMIVLEGQQPLGDDAHKYYDELIDKLRGRHHARRARPGLLERPAHRRPASQSDDGKAAYVQVNLAGNQGEALANESVEAVRDIVDSLPAPDGVTAYVTGPAALSADQQDRRRPQHADDRDGHVHGHHRHAAAGLPVDRHRAAELVMVVLQPAAARGVVAFLGYHEIIGLSTFATNLLVTLAIAAATDYAIFLIGRYQEARGAGEDRESAYYTMFGGTAHVVLGSGLTIAGATFCLSFTRLPYFQTLGVPLAIGMLVCVIAALTLGPAVITVASRFGAARAQAGDASPGLAQDRRRRRPVAGTHPDRDGRAVAGRAADAARLPDQLQRPQLSAADLPANEGYAAADRHFSPARMNPELLMIESDRDLRNSADFLVIEKIAKAVFQVAGIAPRADHHAARGQADRAHLDPVPDEHAGHHPALNQKYNAGSHGRHARSGRRHADDHRHDDEDVRSPLRWPTPRTRWCRR